MPASLLNRPTGTREIALRHVCVACVCVVSGLASAQAAAADERGVPTSLFGTYVREGELLVYPFYEYDTNRDNEYTPSELGVPGEQEFLGKLTSREYGLFLAYGLTERLAVELEGELHVKASFEKAPEDGSGVPARLVESGLGDVEAQLRYRWRDASAKLPELFSFLEVAFPTQNETHLIGSSEWEVGLGFGAIKEYGWGLLTGRVQLAYETGEGAVELGEYAVEIMRDINPHWRLVSAIEGQDDEITLVGEAQWRFAPRAVLKLNCGFGVTEKAPDFAPEIGVLMIIE